MDEAQLKTIWQQRQFDDRIVPLGGPLGRFMKSRLAPRVRQVGRLAEAWDEVIPEAVRDHTALESFRGGVLTVVVDSAAHRFRLRTLLSGGLLAELQARARAPVNKVKLVPGQFTAVDTAGALRYEF